MKPCPKHPENGIIDLAEGCPLCIAERQAADAEVNSPANIAKRIKEAEQAAKNLFGTDAISIVEEDGIPVAPPVSIVKVQYSMTKNAGTEHEYVAFEGRAYSYFTAEPLDVGDVVEVPVQNHNMKGKVVEINVPESQIAAFRDKVKTIPAGSRIVKTAQAVTLGGKIEDTETALQPPLVVTEEPLTEGAALEPSTVTLCVHGENADTCHECQVEREKDWFNAKKTAEQFGTVSGEMPEPPQEEVETGSLAAAAQEAGAEVTEAKVEITYIPPALATIETQVGKSVPGLFVLYQEAASLLQFAKARVIATNEDLKPATNDLSIIATCKKAMTARKTELVGPLKAKLDLVNQAFNDIMFPVMEADRLTRAQVGKYDQDQRTKAAEAKRIEDEKARLAREEAAFNGTGEITVPTGTIEQVAPPPERTRTEMGTLGGRDNWKARVVDFKLLDDQWKLANESLLNSHARSTKGERPIPGVEFYNDRITTIRTKGA